MAKKKIRISRSGYDVISNVFFVELYHPYSNGPYNQFEMAHFYTFDEYYSFVNGDIYTNSCFYQYVFSKEEIEKHNIDISKINFVALISETIDDDVNNIQLTNTNSAENYKTNTINLNPESLYTIIKNSFIRAPFVDITIGKKNLKVQKEESCGKYRVTIIDDKEKGLEKEKIVRTFDFFFDFAYYLHYDLSYANLYGLNGIQHIKDFSNINLDNAIMPSFYLDLAGAKYETLPEVFTRYNENKEEELENILVKNNNEDIELRENYIQGDIKIYYISDLHLEEKILKKYKVKTQYDIKYHIEHLVNNMLEGFKRDSFENAFIVINGDTADDFEIFKSFIAVLQNKFRALFTYKSPIKPSIIVTLGNHELFEDNITKNEAKDKKTIKDYGEFLNSAQFVVDSRNTVFFLNDSLLYFDVDYFPHKLSYEDIKAIDEPDLRELLRTAKVIFLGGYGETLQFDQEVYNEVSSRLGGGNTTTDVNFLWIYDKVTRCIENHEVIVSTHIPTSFWINNNYRRNCVYLYGHTHINYFYIGENYRIYADNQVFYPKITDGYYSYPSLKYFYLDAKVDVLESYKDGVYDISKEDYLYFLRGKNIMAVFNRKDRQIKMLKRDGYYMFVSPNKKNGLCVLNGGSLLTLPTNDINYYYEHMLEVIRTIDTTLFDYKKIQKQIAAEIKNLGGDGTIHGSIIDIDFYDHLFLNFYDYRLTPYFAYDIIERTIYRDVPNLLKDRRPDMYQQYIESQENGQYYLITSPEVKSTSLIKKDKQHNAGTEMYKQSRTIRKMEKVEGNILTIWPNTDSTMNKDTSMKKVDKKIIKKIGKP